MVKWWAITKIILQNVKSRKAYLSHNSMALRISDQYTAQNSIKDHPCCRSGLRRQNTFGASWDKQLLLCWQNCQDHSVQMQTSVTMTTGELIPVVSGSPEVQATKPLWFCQHHRGHLAHFIPGCRTGFLINLSLTLTFW